MPPKTKPETAKAAPRLRYGIFIGYDIAPGGEWAGQYKVIDLEVFANADLDVDASPKGYSGIWTTENRTSVVRRLDEDKIFPLKQEYIRRNTTIHGVEEHSAPGTIVQQPEGIEGEAPEREEVPADTTLKDLCPPGAHVINGKIYKHLKHHSSSRFTIFC